MGIEANLDTPLAEAVRNARGQSSFARLIGRNQSTVYDWLKNGKPLPAELCALVARETGVSHLKLRPDIVWPDHATALPVGDDAVAFDPASIPNGDRA